MVYAKQCKSPWLNDDVSLVFSMVVNEYGGILEPFRNWQRTKSHPLSCSGCRGRIGTRANTFEDASEIVEIHSYVS